MTTTRFRIRALDTAVWVALTLFTFVLLFPLTTGKGPEMDEGAVLAYSARVFDGAVPHRDFLTFYGPGNLWFVAGAFEVFGTSITTERAVGLAYRLLIVLSVVVLARRLAGTVAAALAGVVAVSILAREVIWAYATYGAIAFGLLSLVLMSSALSRRPSRAQKTMLLAAGAAAGAAVLVRYDFTPAVVLSALPVALLVPARDRWWSAGGFLGVAGLYVPHLLIVGPERVGRLLDDLAASGDGRSLPVPEPWVSGGHLLFTAALVTGLLVATGTFMLVRNRRQFEARLLLSIGIFNAVLFPYALSRADVFHIRPVAIVPLSLLPAIVLLWSRILRADKRVRAASTVGVVLVATVLLATRGEIDLRRLTDPPRIENAGRAFYDSDEMRARTVNAVVAEADRLSRPEESLYIGPLDLRRMNYGPTYLYFLLPKLRPASYYMEMNPLTATREGSGFADELRSADWLILTSEWDSWSEPNASTRYGPAEPNDIVRDLFCRRFASGSYRLYERCDRRGA